MDFLAGNLSEEKDYKIFHCEGNYECQKIQDSLIAKPLGTVKSIRDDAQIGTFADNLF